MTALSKVNAAIGQNSTLRGFWCRRNQLSVIFLSARVLKTTQERQYSSMTSTVTARSDGGAKELRERFRIKPGTTLDWQEDGDSIRVVR